jgi:hypothetical protein
MALLNKASVLRVGDHNQYYKRTNDDGSILWSPTKEGAYVFVHDASIRYRMIVLKRLGFKLEIEELEV